ncbi:LysR family transcriptional regulator [Pseudomonas putida]|uniref:HTH lysR-type domain-containing protein n=1 Tax=Pseudomonas putida TaxID=303 RepID=A0A1Q9R2P3_PSEPU|nr:LysR family transcriptional regulator [Pseudomonas putida]OLS61676.1 hypothetical protein PSEMO_34890 [Pseudomonas putida]
MKRINWDDLWALAVVARAGTLRRASVQTGVSAPTLSRKIDEVEHSLGEKLLERTQVGCFPTPAGLRVLAWANQMEEASLEIERTREHLGAKFAEGIVRINTDEWMSYFLTTRFADFHNSYPNVEVEIITSHRPYSLVRREADLSIRPFRPEQAGLITRKMGKLTFGLYCNSAYREKNITDIAHQNWSNLSFVGFDEQRSEFEADRWLRKFIGSATPWMRCSYALGIYDGVTTGAGLGVLANFITRNVPTLEAIVDHIVDLDQDIWLSMHAGLRNSARVRAVADYIAQLFSDEEPK